MKLIKPTAKTYCKLLALLGLLVPMHQDVSASAYLPCIDAPALLDNGLSKNTVVVRTAEELSRAIGSIKPNTTVLLKPGRYKLPRTMGIEKDNITIRGMSNDCSSVELVGAGMENANHKGVENGFWIGGKNITIANMTISEVYLHAIQVDGNAQAPRIHNVRMINTGQQFVKVNPLNYGVGADNGTVEYSIMQYTDTPPMTSHNGAGTGYTNGVDIHAGKHHTPNNADHLWNAAVIAWNGARDTVTQNNQFIDVDRAIAYGLDQKSPDHVGGIIRNNTITMSPGLYTTARRYKADAPIVVWDSPLTKVLHNTILTNGNMPFSIELRFDQSGIEVANNLADAPIISSSTAYQRRACKLMDICNIIDSTSNQTNARSHWFKNAATGDLHLLADMKSRIKKVPAQSDAPIDLDGDTRATTAIPGADW